MTIYAYIDISDIFLEKENRQKIKNTVV